MNIARAHNQYCWENYRENEANSLNLNSKKRYFSSWCELILCFVWWSDRSQKPQARCMQERAVAGWWTSNSANIEWCPAVTVFTCLLVNKPLVSRLLGMNKSFSWNSICGARNRSVIKGPRKGPKISKDYPRYLEAGILIGKAAKPFWRAKIRLPLTVIKGR